MKKKDKSILVITTMHSRGWGGSEELWHEMAGYAKEDGYRVKVIAFFEDEIHLKFKLLHEEGIEFEAINTTTNSNRLLKVAQKIERSKLGMGSLPHYFYQLVRVVKELDPNFIVINQGGTYNFIEFPALLYLLDTEKAPVFLISQHNHENYTFRYVYLEKLRKYIKKTKGIFFVSERNREVAQRQLATPGLPPFFTIKNPCKLFFEEPLPFPKSGKIKLAAVTRLDCSNKCLDLLFESLSDSFFANIDWQLELYGMGPDQQYLIELCAYFGLQDKVIFKGTTNDIAKVWEDNELLLLPSYNEGTPLSILEAQMCGRACFVTDVGDNEKLVTDLFNGYLVEAPTKKLILHKLKQAFANRGNWEDMGKEAHKTVKAYIDFTPGRTLLDNLKTISVE